MGRETQKTVSEIGQSWRTISDSLRDPLNIGATLSTTYGKYSEKPAEAKTSAEAITDLQKGQFVKPSDKNPAELSSNFEPVEMLSGKETPEDWENETPEELEQKRAASREAAKALMYNPNKKAAEESTPPLKDVIGRLDRRMLQLDDMVDALDELKSGILRDREELQRQLKNPEQAEAENLKGDREELQEQLKQQEQAAAENPKGDSSEPAAMVETTDSTKPMTVVEAAGMKAPVDSLAN